VAGSPGSDGGDGGSDGGDAPPSDFPPPAPWTFALHFHFRANPYFTNTVLTKTYTFSERGPVSALDHTDLLDVGGTPIDWAPGKNVTVKVLRRGRGGRSGRGRGRGGRGGGGGGGGGGAVRTEPTDSFFNFFAPPPLPPAGDAFWGAADGRDGDSDDGASDGGSSASSDASEEAALLAELFDADIHMAAVLSEVVVAGAVHLVGGTFEGWRGGRPYRACAGDGWDSGNWSA